MYDGTLFDEQAGVFGGGGTCMMVPCLTSRRGCMVGVEYVRWYPVCGAGGGVWWWWNMYDGTLFDEQAGVFGGGGTCMMVPCLTSRRGCLVVV